jgi:hypothetical protein
MATRIEKVLAGLRCGLSRDLPDQVAATLEPLADTGLAHWRYGSAGAGSQAEPDAAVGRR